MKASFVSPRWKQMAAFCTDKTGDTFFFFFKKHWRVFLFKFPMWNNSLQIWTSYILVTWVPVVLSQTDLLMISMGVTCTENQYCWHWINGVQIYYVWYMNRRNYNLAVWSSKLITFTEVLGPSLFILFRYCILFQSNDFDLRNTFSLPKYVYLQQGN